MRVKQVRVIISAVVTLYLFSLTSVLGVPPITTVYTDKIDMAFMGMDCWYDFVSASPLDGKINFNDTSISSSQSFLSTFDDIGIDNILSITGGFTFTSDITSDYSSGGLAKGWFEGGATVSFVGTISQEGTYLYGDTVTDLTIFEATLRSVYDEDGWNLEEDPMVAGSFNRTLEIELNTSVGLGSGITFEYDGMNYTLKMAADSEYPKMKLELKSMLPVNNFKTADLNSGGIASHVKITSTPEPATLMLVGLGAFLLRTRGKKG